MLTWSAFQPDRFNINPTPARTITATLDPVTLSSSVGIVVETNHDMFCPGISAFGNGDIVVTGGDNAEKTSIFRLNSSAPGGGAWFPGPNMNIPRGYQSSVTLSNGQVCNARGPAPLSFYVCTTTAAGMLDHAWCSKTLGLTMHGHNHMTQKSQPLSMLSMQDHVCVAWTI